MQTVNAQKTATKSKKLLALLVVNCYTVCKLTAYAVNVNVTLIIAALQQANSNVAQN